MTTFDNEPNLPRLPVPELLATVHQLLMALKPLISIEEYNELLNESTEFMNHKLVNLLQSHLKTAGGNPDHSCYLNCINDETNPGIYSDLRGDVLPRNPYLVLQEDPYSKFMNPPNQQQRAATLINSSLKFILSLRNETLRPDVTPKSQVPLTMNCYKNLFGTTRIPYLYEQTQYHQISIQRLEDSRSNHIIVISNNQFYYLPVLNEENEIFFNDYDLSLLLAEILEELNRFNSIESINNAVGALSTQNYNHWRLSRLELMKSNASNLELIDNALFVVVLDSNTPETDQEKTEVISHGSSKLSSGNVQIGTCTSRWYDKFQLIITKNSVAGVVWESTSMDATAILRFISDIYTDSILKLAKNINAIEYSLFGEVRFMSNKLPKPSYKRMVFHKTPELSNLIHLSETRLADLINQHNYTTVKIKFNSDILENYDISTDSFLQMCIQIANYSLYGKISNTLELITTRRFKDARTELIAVQNDDIANLVKLFITNASKEKKWEVFERCCHIHRKQYINAMNGKGFEKHLTSLLHIIKSPGATKFLNELNRENNITDLPSYEELNAEYIPLLSNPILTKISGPELLICNCGNPALHLFGIPPAIDQGFGIGYIIHEDKVLLTLSSKFRQNDRFIDTLVKIINEVKSMIVSQSDFLFTINKDNEHRKYELDKLRIESELKSVNIDSPSTKHPIELAIDQFTIPVDSSAGHESDSTSNSNTEFDYLGGYGYFDFGEVDLRNIEQNRSQSFLNSPSLSSMSSRNHSHQNLPGLIKHLDLKEKHDLNERIREKLNQSADDLRSSTPESFSQLTPKHSIGRQLNFK